MDCLIVDGRRSGTGVKDGNTGVWLYPDDLGLGDELVHKIIIWVYKYMKEHCLGYQNTDNHNSLDEEGLEIVRLLQKEFPSSKIEYYSDIRSKVLLSIEEVLN